MPQFQSYPLITTPVADDLFLIHQASSGAEKTVRYEDMVGDRGVYIDVRDFGAIGDGVADDTAAITDAIASASVGSIILFASGKTFKTTSAITISTNNVTLLGYGAIITSTTDSQFRKFLFQNRSRGSVRGLRFQCLYSSAATGLSVGTIEVSSSTDISIIDCEFNDVAKNGIFINGSSARVTVNGCKFYRNFCAIFTDDDSGNQPTQLIITRNTIRSGLGSSGTSFSGGIKMSGTGSISSSAGHLISNNIIDTTGEMGIEIQTWVNDCVISNNTIFLTGFGISISDSARVCVSGNVIKGVISYGLEASGSTGVSFNGNEIYVGNAGYGVLVASSSVDVSVTGGAIYGGLRSVYIQDSSRVSVTGVVMSEVIGGFIYNQSSSDYVISSNTFRAKTNNTTVGFIDIDSTNSAAARGLISGNIFTGTVTNNGITLNTPANSITDLVITGNNTALMSAPGGAFSEQGGSHATRILRVRCFGNIGYGSGGSFDTSFNVYVWDVSSSQTFFYRYYAMEGAIVKVNATGGAISFEAPSATRLAGYTMDVVKTDASGNAVTITGYSGQTFSGAANISLAAQNDRATIRSDGANWVIIQSN